MKTKTRLSAAQLGALGFLLSCVQGRYSKMEVLPVASTSTMTALFRAGLVADKGDDIAITEAGRQAFATGRVQP
jgi:hypothetical protein